MPTIKNISSKQRMVVDRWLIPGAERYISPKQAKAYEGDADFEIVDETPKSSGQQLAVPQGDDISNQPVTLLKVQVVDDKANSLTPNPSPKMSEGKKTRKKKKS